MKTKRILLASSLSLALAACQQETLNTASSPILLQPQNKLNAGNATQSRSPGKRFEVEAMSATLVQVGNTHELNFSLKMPQSFRTQVVDSNELKKIKITVMGEGIATPLTSNFATVVDGEATVTIKNIPISGDKVRVVSAQGYDENNNMLPAFEAKAVYKSSSSNITINLNRRQLVVGEVIEELLSRQSALANSLNTATLQTNIDTVLYGSETVGGPLFAVDPLHFDITALANEIVANGVPSVETLKQLLASAVGFEVSVFLGTGGGNQFGEDLTVIVNDPGSTTFNIRDGANSPTRATFKGILPGSWQVVVKKANGTIVGKTTLVVDNEGNVTLGSGTTSAAPFSVSGVDTRTVDCSSSTTLPVGVLAVSPCGDSSNAADGRSWATAYTDLNAALSDVTTPGTQVWVAVGTYTPDGVNPGDTSLSFDIPGNVALYGGFVGGETLLSQRNVQAKPILSGDLEGDDIPETWTNYDDNSTNVITDNTSSGDSITLDGFIVEGGNSSRDGGGFDSDDYVNLTIANSEFRHNRASAGGGLYWYTDDSDLLTLNITDTVFNHNHASAEGGGAYIYASSTSFDINLTNVLFENNTADDYGGGAYFSLYPEDDTDNTVDIENSIFRGNSAEDGGGIYLTPSSDAEIEFNITNTIFENNTATNKGGGVYAALYYTYFNLDITNSIFRNNTADYGGGLCVTVSEDSATLDIQNTVFYDNQADNDGGGIYIEGDDFDGGELNVLNSIFVNNTAGGDGGAIAFTNTTDNDDGLLNIYNSVFYGNQAQRGGALFATNDGSSANFNILNSIFWANTASSSGQHFYSNDTIDIDYSIVEGLNGPDDFAGSGDYNVGGNMLSSNPMFANVNLPWGVDGIPGTRDDGLIPLIGSPAINAGDTIGTVTTDILGTGRPIGAAYDIGAFEIN